LERRLPRVGRAFLWPVQPVCGREAAKKADEPPPLGSCTIIENVRFLTGPERAPGLIWLGEGRIHNRVAIRIRFSFFYRIQPIGASVVGHIVACNRTGPLQSGSDVQTFPRKTRGKLFKR
jgi:hypothetical protein